MPRETHLEPFLHLAGLGDDEALLAWGGFYFRRDDGGGPWRLVDDDDLPPERTRDGKTDSIGAAAPPYGAALVEVARDGEPVARVEADERTWAWVRGLEPDTEYTYRVLVDGDEWAAGERWDWDLERGTLAPSGRRYENRFRTFPPRDARPPAAFAVIGDFGIGILHGDANSHRQLRVAQALERAVDDGDVRFVVTVGDNIYLGEEDTVAGSGDEDDDWYSSFYAPYRYVLNRVPFFPCVGNHDTADTEKSDDRDQLDDNYFLDHRFRPQVQTGRASLEPGLFYRFAFGSTVELVAIDTSVAREVDGFDHYFQEPEHARWVRESLRRHEGAPDWQIPFSHHPAFCAGPHHSNTEPMVRDLVPLFEEAGVQLVLAGHEHNFQYSVVNGVHYVVSGAGGKLREGEPCEFERAHTAAWAQEGHFLLVRADSRQIEVEPVGGVDADGRLRPIELRDPHGGRVETPLRIERAGG